MTPAQRDVYLVIDEWWKRFGFGPTIEELMSVTGDRGRGNIVRKMNALVRMGACKRTPRVARSIRPSYMKIHEVVR